MIKLIIVNSIFYNQMTHTSSMKVTYFIVRDKVICLRYIKTMAKAKSMLNIGIAIIYCCIAKFVAAFVQKSIKNYMCIFHFGE